MASDNRRILACAIYTRKSSEEGLEQEFNSLDAQREACEAFILSQRHEGWKVVPTLYDDGGFSGGNMERPALNRLMNDIRAHKVDVVVVYKVDRLTRALSDFAKIVEVFDSQSVSFVSVTQQFNTTTSMGRLTLNVLLSFAQFEREVTGERIRDKIAASKKKGLFMGGGVPLGYDVVDHRLVVNEAEAATVRTIFSLYVKLRCARRVQAEAIRLGIVSKIRTSGSGRKWGGARLSRGHVYYILKNRTYLGEIAHKGHIYDGQHEAIVDRGLWDQAQGILTNNVRDRSSGKGFADPSLLAGVLFDAQGNRLTPSHTQRSSVRYRYYVSQAYIQNQPEKAGAIKRVSAIEIEELVARQVRGIFRAPERLVQHLMGEALSGEAKQSAFSAIARIVGRLDDRDERGLASFSRSVISRIVVDVEAVTITFDRQALNAQLGLVDRESERVSEQLPRNGTNQEFTIAVPVRLTRFGRQKRMIIGDDKGQQQQVVNDNMLLAVARAITWDQEIRGGASLRRIARRENVSAGYVTRIMPLAFLAPDIVQAIYEGRQPAGLKVKTLSANLPLEWAEQRRVLGFPAH